MRMNLSLGTTLLIATGAVAAWALLRRQSRAALPMPKVRNAGPEEMDLPPRHWDIVDQQLDETFPASDPPGNY